MNIYIFEDAVVNSEIFTIVSKAWGKVTKFTKASQWNEINFSEKCVIIADVGLEDGSFFNAIPFIREQSRFFIPILLVSGKDYSDIYIEKGADEFFLKPVPLHKLGNRLQYWTTPFIQKRYEK